MRVFYFDRAASRAAGSDLTLRAAPIMFSVRDMTEPSALQHAFDDFYFWGSLRRICRC